MKRELSLITFISLININGFSQSTPFGRSINNIEVTGGPGLMMNSGHIVSIESKFGYSFGGGIAHEFNSRATLLLHILWEKKGSKVTTFYGESDGSTSTLIEQRLNTSFTYWSSPLTFSVKLLRKRRLVVGGGAYYSILKKHSITIDKLNQQTGEVTSQTIKDPYNFRVRYDAGAKIFLGYKVPLSDRIATSVQLSYNKGFVEVKDVWNGYQWNNSILLTVGIEMKRKKANTLRPSRPQRF